MNIPTPRDIIGRVRTIRADGNDLLGFRQEVLLEALDYQHASELVSAEVTAAAWDQQRWSSHADTETYARLYLQFAVDKILHHRGNSAIRSTHKLAELAWLLGRGDITAAMAAAPYPMYGAPKIKLFADGLGWPFTDAVDDVTLRGALTRMSKGQQCDPAGCARCGV